MDSYPERVVILTRTLAAADATGEEVQSFPDPDPGTGEHWARIETASGGETLDAPRYSYTSRTLRFRHEVPLTAVDMVRLKDTGAECIVSGVWRERKKDGWGWQTVCTIQG